MKIVSFLCTVASGLAGILLPGEMLVQTSIYTYTVHITQTPDGTVSAIIVPAFNPDCTVYLGVITLGVICLIAAAGMAVGAMLDLRRAEAALSTET
jgi:hypothetical protein